MLRCSEEPDCNSINSGAGVGAAESTGPGGVSQDEAPWAWGPGFHQLHLFWGEGPLFPAPYNFQQTESHAWQRQSVVASAPQSTLPQACHSHTQGRAGERTPPTLNSPDNGSHFAAPKTSSPFQLPHPSTNTEHPLSAKARFQKLPHGCLVGEAGSLFTSH